MGIDDILIGFSKSFGTERTKVLIDTNPTKVVGAGGGKGAITLTDSNPTDTIGAGGGKVAITLTDSNPSVAIT